MKRIDPRQLRWPIDSLTVDSWRSDAYDPEFDDQPITPTRRRPIELVPGVWVYPEFLEAPQPGRDLIKPDDWN